MTESRPKKYQVHERKVGDYKPDPENANRGTRRGRRVLEGSYKRFGAGRSWLADKDGQLVAGNQSRQAALSAGVEDVIEVEVLDPNMQVVIRRPDLDLDGEDLTAREFAFADNRTGEINLDWSPEQIREHEDMLRELEMFRDDELDDLLLQGDVEEGVEAAVRDGVTHNDRTSLDQNQKKKISPVLYVDDLDVFENAITMARELSGERRRAACLVQICQFFLDQHTDDELKDLLDDG